MKGTIPHQLFRFALIGAAGTVMQYGILWIGVNVFNYSAPLSSAVGYIFGSVVNYSLNRRLTFVSDTSYFKGLAKNYTSRGIGFFINIGLMELFVHFMNYLLAQVITTGIGFVFNFVSSKLWVFRSTGEA
jgi:putative flippase GtrA